LIYRWVVEAKLRHGFDALNRGDHQRVMALFAKELEHVFFGTHALAGARHRRRRKRPQRR
jgi:ketosteroid isomerase-like protein